MSLKKFHSRHVFGFAGFTMAANVLKYSANMSVDTINHTNLSTKYIMFGIYRKLLMV